jgi:hypothetical protein
MAGDDDFLDPEMKGLPDDPRLAFVVYEERLRPATRDAERDTPDTSLPRRYANSLIAFIRIEGLPISIETPPLDDRDFWPWYNQFLEYVDYYVVEYKLAHARGRSSNAVMAISFSQNYKQEIAGLLDRIRKIVNQAELEEQKKDAIYAKISALQLEVDRSTTLMGALLSGYLDVMTAIGEGGERLEPAVKVLERLMGVFRRAKTDHDQGQLPPPEEKKQLPSPKADWDELDDEIPF